jgi:hypothetical protein
MPARRSLATMEKDARAADLFRRGLTYQQIATEIGWASKKSAFEAVRRAARDAATDPLAGAEAHAIILERLQDYRRLVWRVATAKHYVTTQSGRVVLYDGRPLVDDAPVLHAVDRLLRCDQEEARLRDLYPATKSRVEVITEDVVDAELADIARQIAENDARAAYTGTA